MLLVPKFGAYCQVLALNETVLAVPTEERLVGLDYDDCQLHVSGHANLATLVTGESTLRAVISLPLLRTKRASLCLAGSRCYGSRGLLLVSTQEKVNEEGGKSCLRLCAVN